MSAVGRNMLRSGLLLGLFAVIASAMVAYTFQATEEQIAANERAAILKNLHQIIPRSAHDNDLVEDTIQVRNKDRLGTDRPQTVYRARRHGEPVAAILTTTAPDGYGGAIKLLVGIRYDGTLAGVRVINHRETPGLGDAIEAQRSDWITDFAGKSLDQPAKKNWKVKKDGGVFDQFTGATITPRAVVKAVKNALIYFKDHREMLFERPAREATEEEVPRE